MARRATSDQRKPDTSKSARRAALPGADVDMVLVGRTTAGLRSARIGRIIAGAPRFVRLALKLQGEVRTPMPAKLYTTVATFEDDIGGAFVGGVPAVDGTQAAAPTMCSRTGPSFGPSPPVGGGLQFGRKVIGGSLLVVVDGPPSHVGSNYALNRHSYG